ncbi:MAG: DNA adenine methylase, partial [Bacteroidota bacterium]
QNEVHNEDANQLITKIEGDILYLDPPYNARQYGANYHLLNTLALYDIFEPKGKTGLRNYYRSAYCRKNQVRQVFEELIAQARFRFIFISYNNEGLMSLEDMQEILSRYGHYDLFKQDYQRFKADRDANRQHKAEITTEYLHVLEKRA